MIGEPFTFGKTIPYDPNSQRNCIDYLKYLSDEATEEELSKSRLNYSILLINILYDNNVGNIIRSANSFGVKEVVIFGRKKIDRRAAVGTEFFTHFRLVRYIEDIKPLFEEYDEVIALENNIDKPSVELDKLELDKSKNYLFVIGNEGEGIPDYILNECDSYVYIDMIGYGRSINVSVASGILLNHVKNKLGK